MATAPTRRALLGGAVIATAAIAAPARGITASSTSEWAALVAAYKRADAYMDAVAREHDRRWKEYRADLPLIGPEPEEPKPRALPRKVDDMTIAEWRALSDAQAIEQARLPEQRQYWVDLTAWKAREKALDARTLGDVDARWEAAVDAQGDAEREMLSCPAPDADALTYKMAVIERSYRGCDLDGKIMAHVFADARRLLGMGAAA